ncbi:DUF397 domain-containing protein [Streptomyces sp. NPDC007904]|jgi:hypothetical protein|uniref:DUF397 domain-containing protein n=1 Tax=Streptomyces sp. NPDC007904 TaxID=3364787 RepID=UPI0036EAAB48
MTTPKHWQRASYSGSGDGNNCVEISRSSTRTAIRDSKRPTYGPLSFPVPAFDVFVEALKSGSGEGIREE